MQNTEVLSLWLWSKQAEKGAVVASSCRGSFNGSVGGGAPKDAFPLTVNINELQKTRTSSTF